MAAEGTPWAMAQELGFLRRKVTLLEKSREALYFSHTTRAAHLRHLETCGVCLNPVTHGLCKEGDLLAQEASFLFDVAQEALEADESRPKAEVIEFTQQLSLLKVQKMEKPHEHSPVSD